MGNASNYIPNLLPNSTTKINRATYVPLTNSAAGGLKSGGVLQKAGYVGSLKLQTGEVDAVMRILSSKSKGAESAGAPATQVVALLQQYEGSPVASQLPAASVFNDIDASDLLNFGAALITARKNYVETLQKDTTTVESAKTGDAIISLNRANTAHQSFSRTSQTSPIGMLNLERLEMTPAGIERGGLIATIPLAPLERTFVVQKEWSVTTQEFTSIITDSLENFSQTGVTENTQLAQATTSQVSHANQFNVTASASGSYGGFVTGSASSSFGAQDSNSQSATSSRQHSLQTTRLASSRVKQSHKTTISTTTVEGTSAATTRKIENPSSTDAMRIDYYSMMRKWYVGLYRYGLRLTYDLTVPEPGATLREAYAEIDLLQKALAKPFIFNVKHSNITANILPGESEKHYLILADQYSVDAPPPPSPSVVKYFPTVNFSSATIGAKPTQFNVQDGYWIDSIIFSDYNYVLDGGGDDSTQIRVEYANIILDKNNSGTDLCAGKSYLWHQTGTQSLTLYYTSDNAPPGSMDFIVNCVPTDTAMAEWQGAVWTALYNAAQNQYYVQQQAISAQIAVLQNQISNVDTLTLRREENDEITKCVLRWLLGPQFDYAFMPQSVIDAFKHAAVAATGNTLSSIPLALQDLSYGVNFTGNKTNISTKDWNILSGQEQVISFINQAIEWENITYFTYSYFWDYPLCWDFIRNIQHNDKTRQAFLRSGSARVVLTIRKGWELAWTYFVNTLSTTLPDPLPAHPYMTIAQQIAAYDSTNYPGIAPANPNGGSMVDNDTPQTGTTCQTDIKPATPSLFASSVAIPVDDATGFAVGAIAIIDVWNAQINATTNVGPGGLGIGAQETQTIVAVDTTSTPNTVTVQRLQYAHSGPFPVVQSSAKGVLIGEWFEYTPTSGTDIGVTLNPSGPVA